MQKCVKENEINNLITEIRGKGDFPGIKGDLILVKDSINDIKLIMKDLTVNVSALVKFQVSMEAIDKRRMNNREKLALWISGIVCFTGLSGYVIDKLIS
jgi:hypothetical protein